MGMKMKMKIAGFIIIGISILCQQNNCDELSTTTLSPSTTSLVSSTGKLENKDLTTPSTLQSTASSFSSTKSVPYTTLKQTVESSNQTAATKSGAVETKTSITSTSITVTHSLRVDRDEAENDEILIDATTSLDGMCLPKIEGEQSYSVESIDGDIMVSTITLQQSSNNTTDLIKFIARRVNDIDLLVNGVTIGVRVLQVFDPTKIWEILEYESNYLEHCEDNPFGIFLSFELWNSEFLKEKKFEFKVWPLPSADDVRARQIAQLLDKFPISSNQTDVSVEIKTDSMERRLSFESILKNESLCFTSSPSDTSVDKIIIYNGNAKFLSSIRRNGNETLFVVPSSDIDEKVMSEVPNESLIAVESEIVVENLKTLPSHFIVMSATFLEICKSINNAIWKNCKQAASPAIKINLAKCEIINDLRLSETIPTTEIKQMLKLLKLDTPPWDSQLTFDVYKKLASQTNEESHSSDLNLTRIATTNYVTNGTMFYIPDQAEPIQLGSLFSCDRKITTEAPRANKGGNNNSSQNAIESQSRQKIDTKFELNDKFPPELNSFDLNSDTGEEIETYNWQVRSEIWVAIGLTVATLGILLSIAILTFILVRVCMEDVLEGNPIGSILLLLALIAQFASFFPFTIEYSGFRRDHYNTQTAIEIFNSMCTIRIFVVSVCYCLTFSLLLSRAIMLASIGSEGGFLSHVNGYIQSIICIFSFLVQLGLSTQLLILMHANQKHVTCENVFYGNWFWAIIGYDGMLLLMLVGLSPFIFRSQRNYQEGILLVITAVLCFVCWLIWIPLSSINNNFREIAVPLGVQATGWIILASLMVPRCFLIVRSIARSDFTQALPSLTSLAFAQANQYNSEPSLYECVNPAMRQQSNDDSLGHHPHHTATMEEYLSPSEVPTLPMRGSTRRNFIEHYNNNIHFNEIVNPSDLPSTPNKMTRF